MISTQQLETFTADLYKMVVVHYNSNLSGLTPPKFIFEIGKKYARIVRVDGPDARSAYAFIDMETGDILKPDGWKRPAKHARGNLNDPHPLACCGPYGVAYLR